MPLPSGEKTRSSGLEVLKGDQISAKGFNPGLKPWAQLFCPFGAQDLVPFPDVDAHVQRPGAQGGHPISVNLL
jgi:hypothetical protein